MSALTAERVDGADPSLSLFRLLDPQVLANPYPLYHRLRAEDPVHWDPFLHEWVVTRYTDVIRVLHEFSATCTPTPEQLNAMGLSALNPIGQVMIKQMLFMDAPAHTRLRGLASQAFAPHRVELLRAHIQEITDDLLEAVLPGGSMDVIAALAEPLPCIVMAEMLGVPVEDHERFKGWSLDIARGLDLIWLGPDSEVGRRSVAARHSLAEYFRGLIAQRRAAPRADMLSGLIAAEEAGDKLNEIELLATCILLLIAGHETTVNLIGNGMLALLRHRDQLRRLQQDPTLIGGAIEELLRYDGPVQRTARIPSEDVTIGGRTIARGEMVMPFIGAADRDPVQFPEPDRLDIGRADNRHIAFGWGIHFCLGAPLARIEGQIAINTLIKKWPKLALATDRPEYRQSLTLRGLKALPVSFA